MKSYRNLIPINSRYGKITFKGLAGYRVDDSGRRVRLCVLSCDCGKTYETTYHSFKTKPYKSCGCNSINERINTMRADCEPEYYKSNFHFTKQNLQNKIRDISLIEFGLISGELPMTYITKMFTLTREYVSGRKLDYSLDEYSEPQTVGCLI